MIAQRTSPNESSGFVLWFSALTNHAVDEFASDSSAVNISAQEGKLMRNLFLARVNDSEQRSNLPTTVANAYWEQILTQARDGGLFRRDSSETTKQSTQAPNQKLEKSFFGNAANRGWYAVAAGLAAMTAGLGLLQDSLNWPDVDGGEVVMRGDEAPQRIAVANADMEQKLRSVVAILDQHQVVYLIKRTKAGAQIQAKLVPGSPAARQLLDVGIITPAHGRIDVILTVSKNWK